MDPMTLSILMALIPSAINFVSSMSTNQQSMDFQREMYQKSYQDTLPQTQVENLKAAGLNPALAYGGQPAQGIGMTANLQAPQLDMRQGEQFSSMLQKLQDSSESKERERTVKLQNDILEQQKEDLILKNRRERELLDKEVESWADAWTMRVEQHNLDMRSANVKADILELERSMKEIDLKYYDRTKQAELNRIVAETYKLSTDAYVARQKLPAELSLLRNQSMECFYNYLYLKQKGLTENEITKQAGFKSQLDHLAVLYQEYLTHNGTDFSILSYQDRAKVRNGFFGALVNVFEEQVLKLSSGIDADKGGYVNPAWHHAPADVPGSDIIPPYYYRP